MLCISVSLFVSLEVICKQNQQHSVEQILDGRLGLRGWSRLVVFSHPALSEHRYTTMDGVSSVESGT